MATTPIQYPYVNGSLFSWSSIELNMNGIIFRGFKSINYERARDRPKVWGNSPDPIGKVVGRNDYTCDAEIYLAEWNAFQASLAIPGSQPAGGGYGDKFFNVFVTYAQNGFDVIQDVIIGCTLDKLTVSQSEGTDPLVRKIELNPIKIYFQGVDDLAIPLTSPPQ